MKKVIALVALFSLMMIGFAVARQSDRRETTLGQSLSTLHLVIDNSGAEPKCSSNSDCKYGGCSGGKCGSCSASSDCNGWGFCKESWCGYCSSNSDCTSWGDCNSGKCSKSPY